MRRPLQALAFALLILLLPALAGAQNGLLTQNFTAAAAAPGIPLTGTGISFNKLTWNVTGTATACTVALDSSSDGVSWSAGGAIAGQTCTSTGASVVTAGTFNFVRMNMTTLTCTGTCSVSVTWTGYVNNPGGGGSGTVSANNGQTNVIATYAAAGGSTTVGPAATSNPSACLPGATSGEACFTAPAVAGTTSNPITISNIINIPTAGNAPALQLGGSLAGVGSAANNTISLYGQAGAEAIRVGNNAGGINSIGIGAGSIGGSSGVGGIPDVAFGRSAAAVWSTDSVVTSHDGLAAITNCRTTVNVTPVTVSANVSTDQNLMAFTLPANCLNTIGRTLRIFVAGVYSTAAASTAQMTLKIKICSVSGCGSGNVASVISIQSAALGTLTITNNAWNGTFLVSTQTGSTAGAWEAHGAFGIDEGALATAADSFFNDSNTATVTGSPSAIDTTAQNFLQITFAFSAASASNSVTQRQLVIDSVN